MMNPTLAATVWRETKRQIAIAVWRAVRAEDSVYRWIEKRALPGHKVGKLWTFKKAEVDA